MNPSDDTDEEVEESEQDDGGGSIATARPPDGGSYSVQTLAAANMTDFLDQLVEASKISSERGARLKRKYDALQERINISRTNENSLLQESHQLQKQLSSGQVVLEIGDGFPESVSSETSKLRQAILQQKNELMQYEERTSKYNREISQLEEEKKQLEREYNHMPKKEELDEKHQLLMQEIQALQDEIDQRAYDVKKLAEDIEQKHSVIKTIQDKDELGEMETSLQNELAALATAPLNLPREMDKLRKSIQEHKEQIMEYDKMLENLEAERIRIMTKSNALREEASNEQIKVGEEKKKLEKNLRTSDGTAKNFNTAKEQEAGLLEVNVNTEMQLKQRINEHKLLYESLSRKNKEKDKDCKALKKLEIQMNSTNSSCEQQERLLEPLQIKMEELSEKNHKRQEDLASLTTEVEALRKTVAQQQGTEKLGEESLDFNLERERETKAIAKSHKRQVDDLFKQGVVVMKQRDARAKDYYKVLHQEYQANTDLRKKVNQIEDEQKRLRDTEISLQNFAQAYELVKTERNITHSQLQNGLRVAMELREQFKLQESEIEMLKLLAESKQKLLGRSQLALFSKTQDKDAQYQELTKVQLQQQEAVQELELQQKSLIKTTNQINFIEQTLNRMQRYFEQAVQSRNDIGLKLIERNEEVCMFHEKLNVQDSVAHKGTEKLKEREDEMNFLNIKIKKLQREIDACRKILPEKETIEDEIVSHQNMLMSTKERLKYLEEKVINANNPERVRFLNGHNPTCAELRTKIEKLQTQLTDCEQSLLEKELLLEQVTRLMDRVEKQADGRKETTLKVGSKVNTYQSKLRFLSHKMMAMISELSMQQAQALRLHQKLHDKEIQLEQAYTRLDAGEPPDADSSKEWTKYLRDDHIKQTFNQNSHQQNGRELPNGVYTTADPRPNAYIPDSNADLPLPKPYGSHAPFKPSQPGTNIRHIRKPQLPPIDI